MSHYVWCKKEECRLPGYRCLLCEEKCYADRHTADESARMLQELVNSGKYKERYIMKRKEESPEKGKPSAVAVGTEPESGAGAEQSKPFQENRVFLIEDGHLKPFSSDDYTASTLYQMVESFAVECRLVRPEDPGNLVFEGKKPSRKTVPAIVARNGDCSLLDSWEALEAKPDQLADAAEVIGVVPVRQVFVLKRK
jgi:hypothetical protein